MRNTIRNVTMVVPVLMTSCQVSENLKYGPATAHNTTTRHAPMKTHVRPVHSVAVREKRSNRSLRDGSADTSRASGFGIAGLQASIIPAAAGSCTGTPLAAAPQHSSHE